MDDSIVAYSPERWKRGRDRARKENQNGDGPFGGVIPIPNGDRR